MKVKVDYDLCQGHAVCVSEAPDVFAFDDDARKVKILREQLDGAEAETLRPRVDAAVKYCPTMALRIAAATSKAKEIDP